MAFSHRPTWHAARGTGSTFDLRNYVTGGVPSRQIQEQDLLSHAFLKVRQPTQGTKEEIQGRDLEKELKLKEIAHFEKTNNFPKNYGSVAAIKDEQSKTAALEDEKKSVIDLNQFDDDDESVSEDSSSSDESDSDNEDAELLRELEKIKREREEERKRKEQEELMLEAKLKQSDQNQGLTGSFGFAASSGRVKRRWDEDVVFRNQAKMEPKQQKRFINDTIRNDFHKRFLNKYMK